MPTYVQSQAIVLNNLVFADACILKNVAGRKLQPCPADPSHSQWIGIASPGFVGFPACRKRIKLPIALSFMHVASRFSRTSVG